MSVGGKNSCWGFRKDESGENRSYLILWVFFGLWRMGGWGFWEVGGEIRFFKIGSGGIFY